MALRFKKTDGDRPGKPVNSGLYLIWIESRKSQSDVCFGSVSVVETHSSPMAALRRKADTRPGRMSAFADTGR